MTLQQVQNFMLALVYLGYTPQQAAANPYVCLASDWLRDTDGTPAGWFTPGTPGPWVEYLRIAFYLRRAYPNGKNAYGINYYARKLALDVSDLFPASDPMKPYILPGSNRVECIEGQAAGWFTPGTGGVRVTTPTGEVIEVSDQEIKNVTEPDLPRWSGGPWINGAIRADMESESFSWLTLKVFDSRLTPQAPPTSKEFSW